jgi:hypothetical protein
MLFGEKAYMLGGKWICEHNNSVHEMGTALHILHTPEVKVRIRVMITNLHVFYAPK